MKSKQLANVLIKVAGLYICLYAIPSFVSRLLIVLIEPMMSLKRDYALDILTYGIGSGVQAAVGIFIIAMSGKIAGFWFKGEDE
jgi:hypothetical protein